MRIVRFHHQREVLWGVAEDGRISVLARPPFGVIRRSGRRIPFSPARLCAPTVPSKIILAGLNYRTHAREMRMAVPDEPVIFLKPPTSLVAHRGKIVYPRGVTRLDFEAELALVVGKTARGIRRRDAGKYILGYTCLNDVSARDLQKKDIQWTRAKGFDSFCPVGPWIETDFNPADRRVRAILNGAVMQDASTADFIFPPDELFAFVSSVMTLYPGDIISTGTPAGIGPMRPGDAISVEIEGIGRLENRVVSHIK